MANPTTYFGWVMPTSTDLVTDLPADFNVFGQGVDTSMQDLLGGTTGQVLSKTSNTNMDFTWVTPTDQTPLTTKGDLFAFSTVDARLPAGTNETRLVADSTQTLGLKYVADTTNYAIAAKADLLVGTAADTLAALTVGTNGQVLTADSTVSPTGLKWATPAVSTPTFVGCSLYKSAAQNVTNGADTAITFDTEQFDTNTFHDNSTNTTRITVPSSYGGKYLFTAKLTSAAVQASGSYRNLSFKKNGSVIAYFQNFSNTSGIPGSNVAWETSGTQILDLVATDYIEMFWYQDSGATNAVNSGVSATTFQCVYLGA